MQRVLPGNCLSLPPLTGGDIAATLARMEVRSAAGPDQWTERELKPMPRWLVDLFADAYNAIENGQPWPDPKTGRLHDSVGATPNYSSCHALAHVELHWGKQILVQLSQVVPPQLRGSLTQRSCSDIYVHLSCLIEEAVLYDKPLFGTVWKALCVTSNCWCAFGWFRVSTFFHENQHSAGFSTWDFRRAS